ncbi:MAG: ZIP family metal transporter [Flavobacteriales bacterium]|nr:ZIP family metal transporter [Flavobacteriales bacterium]
MGDLTLLFALPFVAGVAALFAKVDGRHFTMALSFSGAYILGLSFFHILPVSYAVIGMNTGLLIVAGFLLQVLLEVLTKGIEHGHAHGIDGRKVPYALLIGLAIHSLLEGMPFGHGHEHGQGEDALLLGVIIHKLPEAFILGTVLRSSGVARNRALIFILLFACMSPLGGLLSGIIEHRVSDAPAFFGVVMALVVGIFLHIATTIIYEADKGHRFNLGKFTAIAVGFALAYLSVSLA